MKRLCKLYNEVEFLLNHAPAECDCTEEQNRIYSDLANLKNSIENGEVFTEIKARKDKKPLKCKKSNKNKKVRVETVVKKMLVTRDGNEFGVGSDIAFTIKSRDGLERNRINCTLEALEDAYVIVSDIEVNGHECIEPYLKFFITDMKDLDYIFYD